MERAPSARPTPCSRTEGSARSGSPSRARGASRSPPTWPSAARSTPRLAPAPDAERPDDGGRQPRRVPLKEHGRLAVTGDDDLAASPRDRAHDLARRARRRHEQEPRNRLGRLLAQHTLVVDTAGPRGDPPPAPPPDGPAPARPAPARRPRHGAHREL